MACSLVRHGQIQTSMAKDQVIESYLEKIITRSKEDTVHNRRLVFAKLRDNEVVNILFTELGKQYAGTGGYLRLLKTRFRHGDNALMVVVQFVEPKAPAKAKPAKEKAPKAAAKPAADKAPKVKGGGEAEVKETKATKTKKADNT